MRTLLILGLFALTFSAIGCNDDSPPQTAIVYDQYGNAIVVDQYGNRAY